MAAPSSTVLIDKQTGYINVEDPNVGNTFRVVRCLMPQIANLVGSGAGATVTVSITGLTLPASYNVAITGLSQAAFAHTANRTSSGFDVVLTPLISTATLAAGTFDLEIVYQQ